MGRELDLEGDPEKGLRPSLTMKKILIIDDDQTILHLLKKMFTRNGFDVLVSKDGAEGVEELKRETPSLVITDLKTPSLSGKDLISSIRQIQPELPIIIMTAYPNLYHEKKGEHEIQGYFRKPFDIDELLSSVEKILGD